MPIYVAIQESDRAALREGGGAPDRFIREIGEPGAENAPVVLWSHELDFAAGTNGEKDETWKDQPVDLGWFFGLGRAMDDRCLKANEQQVIPLLSDPLVCVVFLDELRQAGGYAKFKTFSAVKAWANRLQGALSIRFPNERRIGRAPRTLVLVARKQQVTTTEEELKDFRSCIGVNRTPGQENVSVMTRAFTNCYFLDFNLRMGATGRVFRSDDVWEIVIGRLLLAFALSANGNERPYYERPGLKIWRNADCRAGLVPDDESHGIDNSLGALSKIIRRKLEVSDGKNGVTVKVPSPEELHTELNATLKDALPDGTGNEEWRKAKTFPKGWSDFDGLACLEQTRDANGTRWGAIFQKWKSAFPRWRRRDTGIAWELKNTFTGIANSPSNVSSEISRLRDWLNKGSVVADPVAHWKNMAKHERRRVDLLTRLDACTKEFERARAHYVGIIIGSFIFLAVTAALGWAGYHVASSAAALFGGGAALSMPLAVAASVCVAVGALAAFAVVTICHRRAGIRAMNALIETSKAADKAMKDRDDEARAIVAEGMSASMAARVRAGRFRAWMLLTRLQTMLDTELSPQLARGRPASAPEKAAETEEKNGSADELDRASIHRAFLRATRTEFGPFGLEEQMVTERAREKHVADWWNNDFMPVWKKLASGDVQKAGYYPARIVIPTLRRAMIGFLEFVRSDLRKYAGAANRKEIENEFIAWKRWQGDGRSLYAYASAGFTGMNVDERATDSAVIHYNPGEVESPKGVDAEANGGISNTRNIHGATMLRACPLLEGTEWIGLIHHEVRVGFGVDKDGHLLFKGESHVD